MRIAVVGSYGTGLTMRLPRMPEAGETLSGGVFSIGPGGKGSNQAIAASRLGADVSLLTAIGDDEFGRSARALWEAEGVAASPVVSTQSATMAGVILVEPNGENRIVIASGALDELTPEHVRSFATAIEQADIMMVCNEIGPDAVIAALQVAHELGVATLFNPAPARDVPDYVGDLIDYLTPNMVEAQVLAGTGPKGDPETLLDLLRERFRATLVLTGGAQGAWFDDGQTRGSVPAVDVDKVVDTTGAGDAFNAALAVGICHGWDVRQAVRYAAAAGAFAVTRSEVIPGLGRPDDLNSLLHFDQ